MPRGCGLETALGLELAPSNPPRYLDGGLGEVAEETEEESYDLVDGLGDRAYGLCDGSAMASGVNSTALARQKVPVPSSWLNKYWDLDQAARLYGKYTARQQ